MKRAFGLMQAIMIILIVSGVALLTLKYASIQSKHYSDSYLKEQAELFLLSATEAALLAISGFDRQENNNCLKTINVISPNGKFEANIRIEKYFLYNGEDSEGKPWPSSCSEKVESIGRKHSHGMILIQAVVESNPTKLKDHPIRIIRRSIQWP
ncbi:MAG TPA: hypothetical protein EYP79_01930 [Campylobacterales bacterium]|nr:hypothetical protein [Campylobacterales bacterium]